MNRYLCLHGHFYQPPRENPWLEAIELQDSAYPFHDWNERITAECYEPNGAARILDGDKRIAAIVNNYSRISFNVGPTLLSWLESKRPTTYAAILEADRQSLARFGGHGAAIAQAYNHIILPLANRRDKETQILWGLADFRRRFGREPEGMWLPETAVDSETLELLAAHGLRFTILAPNQARRLRPSGSGEWHELKPGEIDPRRPYRCTLPSGATIALFFYDGPIARDIAFGKLLEDGERFAQRLLDGFAPGAAPQLVHTATDGETYGHHHRFGEMALAYCLDRMEERGQARLTIYGEFLDLRPPTDEVEIVENSSWSCAHGVERWRADCGCHIGGGPAGWNQAWRAPLRAALDGLRDRLVPLYLELMTPLCPDPWATRDAYIEVIRERASAPVEAFLLRQAGRRLAPAERIRALQLLEMQRHAQLMFTSCGWFFDEVSGIEATQILAYAGRALQLAESLGASGLEAEFTARLAAVPSNLPRIGDAARLFATQVVPRRLDLQRVAVHHAIVAGFEQHCDPDLPHSHTIHCYRADDCALEVIPGGRMQLTVGRCRISSTITGEDGEFAFAVLNLGGHNLNAGVHPWRDSATFAALRAALATPFEQSNIPEVVRVMDREFGAAHYSLLHLFKDDQRRILQQLMTQTLAEVEGAFRTIYDNNFSLLRFLHDTGIPTPRLLALPVEMVLTSRFRTLLDGGFAHPGALRSLAEEVAKLDIPLDEPLLGLNAGRQIKRQLEKLQRTPDNLALLLTINETLEILATLPVNLDLWEAQNRYWGIKSSPITAKADDPEWVVGFRRLGELLQISPR
ncbi:MAG: hypothetical protein A2005_05085 [Desulfuromonadales bacterium GWC2_61_20]|nr:MAG: hypothetical protein A2005_05085 [Desulfuromonadales bacterium GWC2_61_20]